MLYAGEPDNRQHTEKGEENVEGLVFAEGAISLDADDLFHLLANEE